MVQEVVTRESNLQFVVLIRSHSKIFKHRQIVVIEHWATNIGKLEHPVATTTGCTKTGTINKLPALQIFGGITAQYGHHLYSIGPGNVDLINLIPVGIRSGNVEITILSIGAEVYTALENADAAKLPAIDHGLANGVPLEEIGQEIAVGDVQNVGTVISQDTIEPLS